MKINFTSSLPVDGRYCSACAGCGMRGFAPQDIDLYEGPILGYLETLPRGNHTLLSDRIIRGFYALFDSGCVVNGTHPTVILHAPYVIEDENNGNEPEYSSLNYKRELKQNALKAYKPPLPKQRDQGSVMKALSDPSCFDEYLEIQLYVMNHGRTSMIRPRIYLKISGTDIIEAFGMPYIQENPRFRNYEIMPRFRKVIEPNIAGSPFDFNPHDAPSEIDLKMSGPELSQLGIEADRFVAEFIRLFDRNLVGDHKKLNGLRFASEKKAGDF